MSEFDEYWKDYEISSDYVNSRYSCAEDAYLAGQQSQQGEVDKLQTEIDELQARFEVVLKACDNLRKDIIREHHAEYDKGWKDSATIVYYN